MGFTNRAHIKKLIFRTLSKYLVYRISMNIFSEEPFLSPTRLYGQYPPSQSYLQNKACWLIPLESTCGVLSLLPAHPSSAPTSKSWTSPSKRRKELFLPPLFYTAQALRSRGGVTENVPTLFPSFLHGNGMRAMHLYKDISPPCSEVFRASAYVNAKGGEEANEPIMEQTGRVKL